jgi:hypothetical protein
VDKDQQAFGRLYAKEQGEEIYHAFMTALLFRTVGLLHGSQQLPTTPEYQRFQESTRAGIKGEVTKDLAFKILELPENATIEQIQKAKRRLARKFHPDTLTQQFNEVLHRLGASLSPEVQKALTEGINRGQSLQEVQSSVPWPKDLAAEVRVTIEAAYRQNAANVNMFKSVNSAASLLGSG